ncbi:hypothetical protein GOB86_09940 [Acetobacter lambici]|uniref:Uncharacterized protein n=1 Tax=Acetobacter lambici TaxID=1332824 RepID=A0ABT1F1R4_9PROT|nr:hypothetical protein [Acetobacter lambici]MCP1242999.1 hypothetical protein [Acetobacter lambici]MCP1259131.1 hypothetical protein [Acetobacter lambici]NHO57375.1 hypothetical protein [Acetobacter lambici]
MWTIRANGNGFVLIVDGEEYNFQGYDELLNTIEANNIENRIEILNFFMAFYPEPEWVCIYIEKTGNGIIYGYRNNKNGNIKYVAIDSSGFSTTFHTLEEARYHLNPGLKNGF